MGEVSLSSHDVLAESWLKPSSDRSGAFGAFGAFGASGSLATVCVCVWGVCVCPPRPAGWLGDVWQAWLAGWLRYL